MERKNKFDHLSDLLQQFPDRITAPELNCQRIEREAREKAAAEYVAETLAKRGGLTSADYAPNDQKTPPQN